MRPYNSTLQIPLKILHAAVAQLVERQLPKLNVEGSSPFGRSTYDGSPSDVSGFVSSESTGQSETMPHHASTRAKAEEDLDKIQGAWPSLPGYIRAAIFALIQVADYDPPD